MNIIKSTLTISALMGLTACGGSNAPLTFDQIAEQGSTIALEIIDLPFTDPSTLPTSGSATYDGFVGVEIENAFGVAGELEITANFAGGGNLSGRVFNVVGENGFAYGGELDLDNSTLDRGADTDFEYTFQMDMTGTLDGEDEAVVVDAMLLGDFTGPGHEFIEGAAVGAITTGGIRQDITDGGFVGEMR